MKKDKLLKIAISLNILIALLVVLSIILLVFEINFMPGYDFTIGVTKRYLLKYFTIESNLFMGIMAVIFAIDELKILKGKLKEISLTKYIFKLVSTASVALTFTVVFVYLGPTTPGGIKTMLMNSNLFLHLIVPVLSIIVFIFFEKTKIMTFKSTFYGLIPLVIYGFVYMPDIMLHIKNGHVSGQYDFYHYFQYGVFGAIIAFILQFMAIYLITYLLWKFNKKNK